MTRTERNDRIALAVMAKAPIPGLAKTRLGTAIGLSEAAHLYRAFLLDTIAVLDNAAAQFPLTEKIVVCPDEHHRAQLRSLIGDSWIVIAQTRTGLMGGIVDAFDAAFGRGAAVALVTDADSPLTLAEHLGSGIDLAAGNDISLGPTDDGGYYLVSSRREVGDKLPDLFLGTSFDSSTICKATAVRASTIGMTVGHGPLGFDVDTVDDLRSLAVQLGRASRDILPETRGALARFDAKIAVIASDG